MTNDNLKYDREMTTGIIIVRETKYWMY